MPPQKAYSPDASGIATALRDGIADFFQRFDRKPSQKQPALDRFNALLISFLMH